MVSPFVSGGVPVSVDVRGAEGVAVVQQCGVDQRVALGIIHQVLQVAQVTAAASNAVPSAVLVQDEHLTGTEPALKTEDTQQTGHAACNNKISLRSKIKCCPSLLQNRRIKPD